MLENTERNLNESIIKIRVDLQSSNIKKSGHNKFAGFNYFELSDFLPTLNRLMLEERVNDIVTIEENEIKLTLTKSSESNVYKLPFKIYETPLNSKGAKSMQDIQYLGALNTYYKRYLYLNAFGITDGEIIDSMESPTKEQKEQELIELTKRYTDLRRELTNLNVDFRSEKVNSWFKEKLGTDQEISEDVGKMKKIIAGYETLISGKKQSEKN